MGKLINLTGQKFGRLIVVRRTDNDKYANLRWLCQCECGNEKIIRGSSLLDGSTKSCGCLHKEIMMKHGHRLKNKTSRTYDAWHGIIQRCTNKNNKTWKHYGGRGIYVCGRWMKFENFLDDMGEVPSGLSIERVNNNRGYNKKNCKWATPKEQAKNRRDNFLITFNNKTQCLTDWAQEHNIDRRTLRSRISELHWPIKEALMTPVRPRRKLS